MTKRVAVDSLKYLFSIGLLAWVVYSNWGYSQRVALQVKVGTHPDSSVLGTVVSYQPGESLTVAEQRANGPSTQESELHLLPSTKIEPADARLEPGTAVSITEAARGLAFVWNRHAILGEPINVGAFFLAVLCFFASVLQTIIRWFILVRATGLPFRLADGLRLGLIGIFFSNLLPSSIGGDVIKAYFIAREQNRRAMAVATVVIDRVIALWGLFWFVAVSGGYFWWTGALRPEVAQRLQVIITVALAVVAGTLVGWVVMGLFSDERAQRLAHRLDSSGKVGHAAAEFWRTLWMYRQQPRVVWGMLGLALIGHVGFVLAFYFSSLTLHNPAQRIPTVEEHWLIVPIGMVIQAIPLAPGGAGLGELGYAKLYALLKCDEASGVLGSLVQRVIMMLAGLTGGLVYLRMRSALKVVTAEKEKSVLAAAEA